MLYKVLLLSPAMLSNAGMANRQGDLDLRKAQVEVPQLTLWLGLLYKVKVHTENLNAM